MKKIVILCFETGVVHVFNYNEEAFKENVQSFFTVTNYKYDLNLSEDNCQWLITENLQLNINI